MKSICTKVCEYDSERSYRSGEEKTCRGCGRTESEITEWYYATKERKVAIAKEARARTKAIAKEANGYRQVMTNIKTLGLFSVPVSIANFGELAKDLNEALIADAIDAQNQNPIPAGRSAVYGWQSEGNMDEIYPSYSQLRDNIKATIYSLLPKYGFEYDGSYDDVFDFGMLWANILNIPGGYHMPHIHGTGQTILSGVYYPTSGLREDFEDYYPDEDYSDVELRASSVPEPGDLVLFDPAAAEKRQVIPGFVKRYPYYGSEVCIKPKKSHLVIFPNYLTHMVAPIRKEKFIRMSISFSLRMK